MLAQVTLEGFLVTLWLICVGGAAVPTVEVNPPASMHAQGGNQTDEAPASLSLDVPAEWKGEPPWARPANCGPNCLFVLASLMGRQVSIAEVTDLVEPDALRGSSLRDLQEAAQAIDLPVAARFVSPQELARLPGPYILHGSHSESSPGHFVVVVDYDAGADQFCLIDGSSGDFGMMRAGGIMRAFSGYVLVPRHRRADPLLDLAQYTFFFVVIIVVGLVLRLCYLHWFSSCRYTVERN